jgi:hypothetical protein
MEGYGGPAQPAPTIGQCLNGGYGWLIDLYVDVLLFYNHFSAGYLC